MGRTGEKIVWGILSGEGVPMCKVSVHFKTALLFEFLK
jgi:hypothetical protein